MASSSPLAPGINEILAGGTLTFGNDTATGYEGRIHGVRGIDIRALIADNGSNPVSLTTDGTVYLFNSNTYTRGDSHQLWSP